MIELREWMTIGSKHRWNLKLTRCWHWVWLASDFGIQRSKRFLWIWCIVVNHCTCFSRVYCCFCSVVSTMIHKCQETCFQFLLVGRFRQLFLFFSIGHVFGCWTALLRTNCLCRYHDYYPHYVFFCKHQYIFIFDYMYVIYNLYYCIYVIYVQWIHVLYIVYLRAYIYYIFYLYIYLYIYIYTYYICI